VQGHHADLRQLSNRPIGILDGCLKTHRYEEYTAWARHNQQPAA
jgi:hypothetical protein